MMVDLSVELRADQRVDQWAELMAEKSDIQKVYMWAGPMAALKVALMVDM